KCELELYAWIGIADQSDHLITGNRLETGLRFSSRRFNPRPSLMTVAGNVAQTIMSAAPKVRRPESYLSTPTRQRSSPCTAKETGWPLWALSEISDRMIRSMSLSGASSISYLPFICNSILMLNLELRLFQRSRQGAHK